MRTFLYIDWDFTVAEFPHAKGVEALELYLVEDLLAAAHASDIAASINEFFDEVLLYMRTGTSTAVTLALRRRLNEMLGKSYQEDLYWSREFWMLEIALRLGIRLDPQDISRAVDVYWEGVGSHTRSYPDAQNFLIQKSKIFDGIVIVTSTDARVRPDGAGGFMYDPEFSERQKEIRMRSKAEVEQLLVNCISHVVIGDPHGKDSPDFWAKADEAVGRTLEDHVIIIGDSYKRDIVNGKKFVQNATGILIQREGAIHPDRYPEADRVANSLTRISDIVTLA